MRTVESWDENKVKKYKNKLQETVHKFGNLPRAKIFEQINDLFELNTDVRVVICSLGFPFVFFHDLMLSISKCQQSFININPSIKIINDILPIDFRDLNFLTVIDLLQIKVMQYFMQINDSKRVRDLFLKFDMLFNTLRSLQFNFNNKFDQLEIVNNLNAICIEIETDQKSPQLQELLKNLNDFLSRLLAATITPRFPDFFFY